MITLERAVRELDLSSPDEVAEALRVWKIKGYPRSPSTCPVARYVERRTGQQISVGDFTVRSFIPAVMTHMITSVETVQLPAVVQAFIHDFDVEHAYQDLCEE